jgi:hypothetical protein
MKAWWKLAWASVAVIVAALLSLMGPGTASAAVAHQARRSSLTTSKIASQQAARDSLG